MSKEEYETKLQDALKRFDYYTIAILTHQRRMQNESMASK